VTGTGSIPPDQTLIAVGEAAGSACCWIRPAAGIDAATLAALLGKVVHYDSYSMLVFDGTRCVAKNTFPPRANPLIANFTPAGEVVR